MKKLLTIDTRSGHVRDANGATVFAAVFDARAVQGFVMIRYTGSGHQE
jgi:hypothetical protein